jgi:hypothetical protein
MVGEGSDIEGTRARGTLQVINVDSLNDAVAKRSIHRRHGEFVPERFPAPLTH